MFFPHRMQAKYTKTSTTAAWCIVSDYKKQEMIDNAINFVVGSVIFVIAAAGIVTGFYYLGRYQGRW